MGYFDQDTFDISSFDKGIINRITSEDIPDNAASDSANIDGDSIQGRLIGIKDNEIEAITGDTSLAVFKRGAWIKTVDGYWNLIYQAGAGSDTLRLNQNFYSSGGTGSSIGTMPAYSFVPYNQGCHVACGVSNDAYWVGYCAYDQFAAGADKGWRSSASKIPRPGNSAGDAYLSNISGNAGTFAFEIGMTYQYGVSMVYDYVQESPIGSVYKTYAAALSATTDIYGVGYASVTLTVTANTIASFNARVTGIKLYRREKNHALPNSDYGLWRLVTTKQIADTVWTTSGGNMTTDLTDDNSTLSATYEQETGIADSITSSDLRYELNCQLNNYHFVANCQKTDVPTAGLMMFRSLPYRYDMFNWSQIGNWIKLPESLSAMVAFNRRIWAFSENRTYIINPDQMVIEDTIEGIGCISQRSICITDYGMFWCDSRNAYWHDFQTVNPIGDAIRATSGHWHGFSYEYTTGSQENTPIVRFNSQKNTVIFAIPYYLASPPTNNGFNAWAFHVPRKRWDKWNSLIATPTSDYTGMFTGANGEVYANNGTYLYHLFDSANTKTWNWYSKKWTMDDVSQNKVFYEIETISSGSPTVEASLDGGAYASLSAITQAKTIQIYINASSNAYVDSLSIRYRPMIGKR